VAAQNVVDVGCAERIFDDDADKTKPLIHG
jgi:hypothetical protein